MTSLDAWGEILDSPQDSLLVIRTRGNWMARFAVMGILQALAKEQEVTYDRTSYSITRCPEKTNTEVYNIFYQKPVKYLKRGQDLEQMMCLFSSRFYAAPPKMPLRNHSDIQTFSFSQQVLNHYRPLT